MNTASPTASLQQMVEVEWCNGATVQAWSRWHAQSTFQGRAVAERLAHHARIAPGMRVLDIACGTGDPAISFAQRVGSDGHVTAVDLSDGMVAATRAHARAAGVRNLDARCADMHALPFNDASFDAVTSRFGIMYAVDLGRAIAEVRRVLRTGGRMAFAVWGPPDQGSYAAFVLGPLIARRAPATPPPDVPSPLRFAAPGSLAAALRAVGVAADEETAVLPFPFPGPPTDVWAHFYDLAVPMRPFIDAFSPEERAAAFEEAQRTLPPRREPGVTELSAAFNFAWGTP